MKLVKWATSGILAGLLKIGTGFLFHAAIFERSYNDPTRLVVWRTYPGQMTHMALLSIGAGLLLALIYGPFKRSLPGGPVVRGLTFGGLIWLGAALAWTLSIVLWVNMPAGVAWAWILDSLVWLLLAGALIGAISGRSERR